MRTIIILFSLCVLQPVLAIEVEPAPIEGIVNHITDIDSAEAVDQGTELPPGNIEELRINNEFWYIVLLSGLCITTLFIALSFLKHKNHSAKDIVNITGLITIIFGTIILVMVVSTSEQLTAAIGILGAIAGYLFRSVQDTNEGNNSA